VTTSACEFRERNIIDCLKPSQHLRVDPGAITREHRHLHRFAHGIAIEPIIKILRRQRERLIRLHQRPGDFVPHTQRERCNNTFTKLGTHAQYIKRDVGRHRDNHCLTNTIWQAGQHMAPVLTGYIRHVRNADSLRKRPGIRQRLHAGGQIV
jgi:hypothetical protein